jgi:hypothetical protein
LSFESYFALNTKLSPSAMTLILCPKWLKSQTAQVSASDFMSKNLGGFAVLSRNIVTFREDFFMRKPRNQEPSERIPGFLASL